VAGVGDHHRFIVHEVLGDGPAARAGLLAGDRIVWANGQPAADLTLGALRNLLRSRSGRDVELMIERDGTTLQRTVRLARLV
jgi:C-terminal processing protease CtpA/Prc